MRPKALFCLLIFFTSTFASSLLKRTIHADGSRDFTIVKHIKQNTCSCSCKCVPDEIAEQWLSDRKKPINQVIDDSPASSAVLEAILGPTTKDDLTRAHNEDVANSLGSRNNIETTIGSTTEELPSTTESTTLSNIPKTTTTTKVPSTPEKKNSQSNSSEDKVEWSDDQATNELKNLNKEVDGSSSNQSTSPTLKVSIHQGQNDDITTPVNDQVSTKPTMVKDQETPSSATITEIGSNVDQSVETTDQVSVTTTTSLTTEQTTPSTTPSTTTESVTETTQSTTLASTTSTSPSTTISTTVPTTAETTTTNLPTEGSTETTTTKIAETTSTSNVTLAVKVEDPTTTRPPERTTLSLIIASEPITVEAHVENTTHKELPPKWKNLMDRLKKKLEELKAKKIAEFLATTQTTTSSTTTTTVSTTTIVDTTESTSSGSGVIGKVTTSSSETTSSIGSSTTVPSSPTEKADNSPSTETTSIASTQETETSSQSTEPSTSIATSIETTTKVTRVTSASTSSTAPSTLYTISDSTTTKSFEESTTPPKPSETTTSVTATTASVIDDGGMKTTKTADSLAFVTQGLQTEASTTETSPTTTQSTTVSSTSESSPSTTVSKAQATLTLSTNKVEKEPVSEQSTPSTATDNKDSSQGTTSETLTESTSTTATTITQGLAESSTGLEIAFKTEPVPTVSSSTRSTTKSPDVTKVSLIISPKSTTTSPSAITTKSPQTKTTKKVNHPVKKPKQHHGKADEKEYSYEVDPDETEEDEDDEASEEQKTVTKPKPKKRPINQSPPFKTIIANDDDKHPTTQVTTTTTPLTFFTLPAFKKHSEKNSSAYDEARRLLEKQGIDRTPLPTLSSTSASADMITGLIRGILGEANNVLASYTKPAATNAPSLGPAFVTEMPVTASDPVVHGVPTFNQNSMSPVEQEIASFGSNQPERVEPVIRVTPTLPSSFDTGSPSEIQSSEVRRTQALDAGVFAEKKRLEEARRLREEQQKVEKLHERERQEQIREEMKKRRDEMIKQLQELKEAERRQKELLAEKEKLAEEARALIAQRKALTQANSDEIDTEASTDPNVVVRYKLKPSQCAAINKFTRVFKISDPSDWIQRNCQFAKRYFPQASCSQIQSLIESCFVFL